MTGYTQTTATIVGSQQFDNGDENLEIDITTHVNNIITEGPLIMDWVVKFDPLYETIEQSRSVSGRSLQNTHRHFFEPFVETVFDDRILDDRQNFIEKTNQNLFLYVNKETNFFDLDSVPTVDILDSTETPITGLTGLTVNKVERVFIRLHLDLMG